MVNKIDHVSLFKSRIATEYREADNLIAYITALINQSQAIEDACYSFQSKFNLELAEGDQLDMIGGLVGQGRVLVNAVLLTYFGFDGAAGAGSFGSLLDTAIGARFRSNSESTTGNRTLDDNEYRAFIKARIAKNAMYPNTENMGQFFKNLFNVDQVTVVAGDAPMHYSIQIGKILSDNDIVFLLNTDLAPKIAAMFVTYSHYDSNGGFSFEGGGGLGFRSVYDLSIGGKFASLLSNQYQTITYQIETGAGEPIMESGEPFAEAGNYI